MAINPPIPVESRPARSAFHQRIHANTEALQSLSLVTKAFVETFEERIEGVDRAVQRLFADVQKLECKSDEFQKFTTDSQAAQKALDTRVQSLEKLPPSDSFSWQEAVWYGPVTNGDGSFDERTTLGKLFLEQTVMDVTLVSVGSVTELYARGPSARRAFICAMSEAFSKLSDPRQLELGPLTGADWGRLFDCAPHYDRAVRFLRSPPAAG